MKEEIKKKWVEKLRDGSYKQGQKKLCTVEKGKDTKYCCLGVLTDLAVKEGVIMWNGYLEKDENSVCRYVQDIKYGATSGVIPRKVVYWSGLKDENPLLFPKEISPVLDKAGIKFDSPKMKRDTISLAELNDEGLSFEGIAAVIEELL